MSRTVQTHHGRTATAASVAATLVVAAVLWLSVGVEGLLVAGVVAVVWSVARTEYAVATGGIMYVVLLSGGEPYPAFVAASFVAVFVADTVARWPKRTTGVVLVALLTAGAVFSEASRVDPTWLGAFALLGGFAVVVYTVHRYELVGLDLVGEAEP